MLAIDAVLKAGQDETISFSQVVDALATFTNEDIASAMSRALGRDDWSALQALVLAAARHPGREMTTALCAILARRSPAMTNEDVVELLGDLADPSSASPLRHAADFELPGDDLAHHFNRKCLLALAKIGTEGAYQALEDLQQNSQYHDMRELARELLVRRG